MLFSIAPFDGVAVSVSRSGALCVKNRTGEMRFVGEQTIVGFVVVKPMTLSFTRASRMVEECDGKHSCRHHGSACPEILSRQAAHSARISQLREQKRRRQAEEELFWQQVRADMAEARNAFEASRDALWEEMAHAPFWYRDDYVWSTLALDLTNVGLEPADVHFLSRKERNKMQHALNGNIDPGKSARRGFVPKVTGWAKATTIRFRLSSASRRCFIGKAEAPIELAPAPLVGGPEPSRDVQQTAPSQNAAVVPASNPAPDAVSAASTGSSSSVSASMVSVMSKVEQRREPLASTSAMTPLDPFTDDQRRSYINYRKIAKEKLVTPYTFVRPPCCPPDPNYPGRTELVIGEGDGYVVLMSSFHDKPLVTVWASEHAQVPLIPYDISYGAPWLATYPDHFHGHIVAMTGNNVKGVACILPANTTFPDFAATAEAGLAINYRAAKFGISRKVVVAVCPKCKKLLPIHPDLTQCEHCWAKSGPEVGRVIPSYISAIRSRVPEATIAQKLTMAPKRFRKKRGFGKPAPIASPVAAVSDILQSKTAPLQEKVAAILDLIPDVADHAGQTFAQVAEPIVDRVYNGVFGPTPSKIVSEITKTDKKNRAPVMSDQELKALVMLVGAEQALRQIPTAKVQTVMLEEYLRECVVNPNEHTIFVDAVMALNPKRRRTAIELARFPLAVREQLTEELFKLARSSADADIEVNPGPSFSFRKLAGFAGEHVVLPIGGGHDLRMKVVPRSSEAAWVPFGPAQGLHDVMPPRYIPGSAMRTPEFLKAFKKMTTKCNEPGCSKRKFATTDIGNLASELGGLSNLLNVLFFCSYDVCSHMPGKNWLWRNIEQKADPETFFDGWAEVFDRWEGEGLCKVRAHDSEAVMTALREMPRFSEMPLTDMDHELAEKMGYGHVKCPVCWPNEPYWCPQYSKMIHPTQLDEHKHMLEFLQLGLDFWRDVPDDLPVLVVTDLGELQSNPASLDGFRAIHITTDKDRRGTPGYYFVTALMRQYMTPMIQAAAVLLERRKPVLYCNELQMQRIPRTVLALPPGAYGLFGVDGQRAIGAFTWPEYDYNWENDGLALICRAFGNYEMSHLLERSRIEGNFVFCDNVEVFNAWKVKAEMAVPPVGLTNRTNYRLLSRPNFVIRSAGLGHALGRLAYVSLSGATLWSGLSPMTMASMVSGSSFNTSHVGAALEMTLDEVLVWTPPPRDACPCTGCLLASYYGPLVFCTAGSAGDIVPVRAIAKALSRRGFDTVVVDCLDGKGYDFLRAVQRGEVLSLGPLYASAAVACRNLPFITIGPPELACSITWSLAPPPSAIRQFNFRLGPLFNPLLSWFAGVTQPVVRISSYPGAAHLPRSADGETFLKRTSPDDKPRKHKYLVAFGSSGYPTPSGIPVVQPGDHYSQFVEAETVITHGGAGTVQTAAMAGCRVISVDNTLDRDYLDPTNCQSGIGAEHHEDKVLGLLLGIDFLPFFLAGKLPGFGLPSMIHWYVSAYLLSDIMTIWALYRICSISLVVVPGDWVSTVIASLVGSVLPGGFAALAAIVINVWGVSIFARAGVTGPGLVMKLLRFGRMVPQRPWLWITFLVGGVNATLFVAFIMLLLVPAAGVTRRAYDHPKSYLCFSLVVGLPFHCFLMSVDGTSVLEGSVLVDSEKAPYRLTRVDNVKPDYLFKVPTLVDFESITDTDQPSASYGFLTHNCNTVLYNAISNKGGFGLGGSILYMFVGIASIIAVFGIGFALFVGLSSLMLVATSAITPATFQSTVNEIIFKWRRAALIDRIRADRTVLSSLLVIALLVTDSQSGLTAEERLAYEAVTSFRQDVAKMPEPPSLAETSALINKHIVLGPLFRGKWRTLGIMFGMIPHDFSDAEMAAITGVHPLIREALEIHSRYVVALQASKTHKITFRQFVELREGLLNEDFEIYKTIGIPIFDSFYEINDLQTRMESLTEPYDGTPNEVTAIIDGILPNFLLENELLTAYEAYPVHGDGPASSEDFARLGLDLDEDEKAVYSFIFYSDLHCPETDGSSVFTTVREEPLSQSDMDALSILVAAARSYGATEVEAFTEAVLNAKDILHPRGRAVLVGADARINQAIEGMVSATRPIRASLQWIGLSVFKARHFLHSDPVASALLKPFDIFFTVIGFLCATLLSVTLRAFNAVLGAAASTTLVEQTTVKEVLTAAGVFLSTLDPRHRFRPKSAWALLWERSRTILSKGESLLFSLRNFTYEHSPSYHDWSGKMIELLSIKGLDASVLHRSPPRRAVFFPSRPVGLKEYEGLVADADLHFIEMANARRNMEQSIAAGNGLAIDGAWMAKPEHVTSSLLRYTVPRPSIDSDARAMLSLAADAIFEHHPQLYVNPMPMTVSQVLLKSKWKYSAGLPFLPVIKKRETLRHSKWFEAIQAAAERIIDAGVMPSVGLHAFPKAQVVSMQKLLDNPAAVRTVTAGDRITGTVFNTLLLERNKRVPPAHYGHVNMLRRSEGGVAFLEDHLSEFPYFYTGDGRAFDSTAASEVSTVGSVRLYELGLKAGFVFNEKAAVSLVKSYYEGLTRGLIINLLNGDEIIKTGGGGTGSVATTPDNRDWVELVFLAAWGLVTNSHPSTFYKHFRLAHASDDVLFSTDEYGREHLQEWVDCIRTKYGPDFSFVLEDGVDNLIHLKRVPISTLDEALYTRLNLPVPSVGFRHDPQRLLFSRSAYRSDRAKANAEVMAAHVAERSAGFQLLTAHAPQEYDLVTRDLVDANLEYALLFFRGARASLELDGSGNVIDGIVEITDRRPARHVKRLARKFGVGSRASDWILARQVAAERALKQRRGASYLKVFETWVKPPPPTNESKAYRRWLSYRGAANSLNPIIDVMRLTANKLEFAISLVPSSLIKSAAEPIASRFSKPFTTFDFVIEQYIYRREFKRTGQPVSFERAGTLVRESPYAAATDLAAFYAVLSYPTALAAFHKSIRENRPVYDPVFFPSNDTNAAQVLVYMCWYTMIDIAINATKAFPLLGTVVLFTFAAYRWLDIFYSVQSLLFWLATASASLPISNSSPKDKYALQKVLAAILAAATPSALTWYVPGVFSALGKLGPAIELQVWIPNLFQSVHQSAMQELRDVPAEAFASFHTAWSRDTPVVLLNAPTGTGKSTSLPASICARYRGVSVFLLLPFNRLVEDYQNNFSLRLNIVKVQRDTQRDETIAGDILVMTPGQFSRRVLQFNVSNAVVLIDEAHLPSSEALVAFNTCSQLNIPTILMTGTPGHFLSGGLFGSFPTFDAPPRLSYARDILPEAATFEEAVHLLTRTNTPLWDVLVFDPSLQTLEVWLTQFQGLKVPVKRITAHIGDTGARAAAFATGVIAVGANVTPSPGALIASPEHLVAVPSRKLAQDAQGRYLVDQGNLLHAVVLSRHAMPAHERHQLYSRVGRTRDGLVIPLKTTLDEEFSSYVTLGGLLKAGQPGVQWLKYCGVRALSLDPSAACRLFIVKESSFLDSNQAAVAYGFAAAAVSVSSFSSLSTLYTSSDREESDMQLLDGLVADFGVNAEAYSVHWRVALAMFCMHYALDINGVVYNNTIPMILASKLALFKVSELL
ncbi:polyprotein [Sclerotium rolfsii hypovirus 3]|uniref:Polyprotein n=1 Tax=Sclerotium rolfsii hypovirus 3 TaxID=2490814 RepID=A0ABM7BTB8_9VIRU|nr:polyprotein [Sclerotium rolfsii hypovirus 3]AZF86108.1 polyprotein [Sclerotium rolfsii hypovirus 3]